MNKRKGKERKAKLKGIEKGEEISATFDGASSKSLNMYVGM